MKNKILILGFLSLTSCGVTFPPDGEDVVTPADLTASYWRGVRDQAWAAHKGRPIYHVALIDGREILYAPVEKGPRIPELEESSAEKAAQEALDATEKPLPRKR